jgi:hypothetical protein
MESMKDHELNPDALCKKLETFQINDAKLKIQDASKYMSKIHHRGHITYSGIPRPNRPLHSYKSNDKIGRFRRLKSTTSSGDLRKLILGNQSSLEVPICCEDIHNFSYCLQCGNPGHVVDECTLINGHLKSQVKNKEDSGSASKSNSLLNCLKAKAIDIKKKFVSPLPTSKIGINDQSDSDIESIQFKKSKKKHNPSLCHVALPLVENDAKSCCKGRSIESDCQLSPCEEKEVWELRSGPIPRLLKLNSCQSNKDKKPNDDVTDTLIPKTNAQQATQVHGFELKNHCNMNKSITMESNYKHKDKKRNLYQFNKLPFFCAFSKPLDESSSLAIICGSINGEKTCILIDTGSSISTITKSFAQKLNLRTCWTRDILVVSLANTHVEKYFEQTCLVTLQIGNFETCEELNVLPHQIYNVTLGKNWLKRHKVICDYGKDILLLPKCQPIQMGNVDF